MNGGAAGFSVFFLLIMVIGLGGLVLGIWAMVDALGKPDWVWQQSGESKTTYIVLFVVGFFACQLIGLIAAIVYFNSVRPKLRSVEAGGYRAVGGMGYGGMGMYGAGTGAPPARYGAYGGYNAPPPGGQAYGGQASGGQAYGGQQPGGGGAFPGYDEFGLPLEMPLGGSPSAPSAPGSPTSGGGPAYPPAGQQPGGYDPGAYGQQPGGYDPGAQAPPAYPPYAQQPGGFDQGPYGQQPAGYDPGNVGQSPGGDPASWTPEPPASPPVEGPSDGSQPPGDNSGWPT